VKIKADEIAFSISSFIHPLFTSKREIEKNEWQFIRLEVSIVLISSSRFTERKSERKDLHKSINFCFSFSNVNFLPFCSRGKIYGRKFFFVQSYRSRDDKKTLIGKFLHVEMGRIWGFCSSGRLFTTGRHYVTVKVSPEEKKTLKNRPRIRRSINSLEHIFTSFSH
jgi:hypothetical protein